MDLAEVALQAECWANDDHLPAHVRSIAGRLADLASILTDARYGCASDNRAAEILYRILAEAVQTEKNKRASLFGPIQERRKTPRYLPY